MSASGVWVVKIGGTLCEDEAARRRLAESCASLRNPLLVVHGGGKQASDLQMRLGGAPSFVEGRRVTTPEALGAVEMALCGAVNKALVRELIAAGRRAVGLSGCDGGIVRCRRVDGLGEVGSPDSVDVTLLETLLHAGFTPVVAPISLGPAGEPVNVNADEIACALAVALGAQRLLLLSDVPGVMAGGMPVAEIDDDGFRRLLASGEVTDGMRPKLRAAWSAASSGVEEVVIGAIDRGPLASVEGSRLVPGRVRSGQRFGIASGKGSRVVRGRERIRA